MTLTRTRLYRFGLSALHRSGLAAALGGRMQGRGAIFMLHHVRPATDRAFAPNGLLEITPEFLDEAVGEVRRAGYDLVSLDEAHARMTGEVRAIRPFACFTFDDGYRDNRDYALPVMKRHGAPFAIYVTSDFADGNGFLWWLVLEDVIRRATTLTLELDGTRLTRNCASPKDKARTWEFLYWRLRDRSEAEARAIVSTLAAEAGIDPLGPCRALAMTWPEIAELACDPLVTIGAHSVTHFALGKLSEGKARSEIVGSIKRIEYELGKPCHHFCYPYGDPASAGAREIEMTAALGLRTAVTTRKGFVHAEHAGCMTGLPRVSINGDFQNIDCFKALLSGVPFALWNKLAPTTSRIADGAASLARLAR